jgi:hypothetical protein
VPRRARTSAAVLLGYAAISFLYFGVRLLPHPGRLILGTGTDPEIFVWSVAWWPHAILHGDNPFVSHAIWAPDGINLAWTTSVPAIAVAVAPVTLLFGPVAGYNVAALLLPALGAWAAFLLCRHVTRAFWPSLAGGYLFGFSSYMLGQQLGHLHMTAVFVVPLAALVVLRFLEGELDGGGLAWRLGLLLGLQVYLSTELFFTLSLSLAAALALAYACVPALRGRIRAVPRPLAAAYALAVALASPLLAYAAAGFEATTLNEPDLYSADLLNLVLPTRLVAAGGGIAGGLVDAFPGNDAERGAYVGLPALLVVCLYAWSRRRRPAARFLVLALALAVAVSLGTALWVGGHRVVPLPWELVSRLPLFNNVLPVRFSLFASLAVAVVVAIWSASRAAPCWARILLPAAAVLAIVPGLRQATWLSHPERPAFFAQPTLLEACIPPGENLLIFPYGYRGSSMLWQAESGFRFRMAEGYLRPDTPNSFDFPAVRKAVAGGPDPTIAEILQLARAKRVARVVSLRYYDHPSYDELRALGPVQSLGDVLIGPACGHPPLTRPGS